MNNMFYFLVFSLCFMFDLYLFSLLVDIFAFQYPLKVDHINTKTHTRNITGIYKISI